MPHVKNVYRYKNIVEVERVYAARYGRHEAREARRLPTPEEMQEINKRNTIKRLRRKIHMNFEPGDLFLTLTYRRGAGISPKEAARELRNYFDRLKRMYRKAGVPLKYIVVTEYTRKSIHHHVILNDLPEGRGAKEAASKWTRGGANCKYLYEEGHYEILASYLVKECGKHFGKKGNAMKSRYSCSRNLKEPRKETVKLKRDDWPEEPRIPKGYILDKPSLWNGINKLGYRYQYYRMIRLASAQKGRSRIVNTVQKGNSGGTQGKRKKKRGRKRAPVQ